MDWIKLDLTKASNIKKETDAVIAKLNDLSVNGAEFDKAAFVSSVQMRILEIENFCLKNSDDDRAILFEKERLRLRKALQPFYTNSKDGRSVSTHDLSLNNSINNLNIAQGAMSAVSPRPQGMPANGFSTPQHQLERSTSGQNFNFSSINRSIKMQGTSNKFGNTPSTSSKLHHSNKLTSPSVSNKIYAWEDMDGKPPRKPLFVDNIIYEPSVLPGFYNRRVEDGDNNEDALHSDKFIDFQIILTQEEITTLAARKKTERNDVKIFKSKAAATSVHSTIPYVDQRRIKQDMLRPGNPDKWIDPNGIRPYLK